MPRIKLNLRATTPWTKVPNYLIDVLLPTLRDTELRILLILLRQTVGWNQADRAVILPYRTLMKRTGRASEAVGKAIRYLREQELIHTSRPKAPKRYRIPTKPLTEKRSETLNRKGY